MKSTNLEIVFNDLGMIEISDQELLQQIAGGMASMESQENLSDTQCNCSNTNCTCTH